MLPDGKTWKSWDATQKVSYAAQVATCLSFLAAMIFSYLTWREAKQARQEQRQFFISEKGPSISVVGSNMNTFNDRPFQLHINIKNRGLSRAKDLKLYGSIAYLSQVKNQLIPDITCTSNRVEKDSELICSSAEIIRVADAAGYDAASLEIPSVDTNAKDTKIYIGGLTLTYEGEFGDRHSSSFAILANRK